MDSRDVVAVEEALNPARPRVVGSGADAGGDGGRRDTLYLTGIRGRGIGEGDAGKDFGDGDGFTAEEGSGEGEGSGGLGNGLRMGVGGGRGEGGFFRYTVR